jgi:hypothetical protein
MRSLGTPCAVVQHRVSGSILCPLIVTQTEKILKGRFQQHFDLDRSVNICAFGGWGCRGRGKSGLHSGKGISPISPFPCTSNVEACVAWIGRTCSGLGTP